MRSMAPPRGALSAAPLQCALKVLGYGGPGRPPPHAQIGRPGGLLVLFAQSKSTSWGCFYPAKAPKQKNTAPVGFGYFSPSRKVQAGVAFTQQKPPNRTTPSRWAFGTFRPDEKYKPGSLLPRNPHLATNSITHACFYPAKERPSIPLILSPAQNVSGSSAVNVMRSPVRGCVNASDHACSISLGTFAPRELP